MLLGYSRRGNDDVLAMQMLLAARSIAPNLDSDADFQLLSLLNQERDIVKILGTPSRVYSVALSPDGQEIVAAGGDHTARLWDTATGKPGG